MIHIPILQRLARAILPRLVGFAALAVVGGCSSSNPVLYTVTVVPGQPVLRGPPVVSVREVSIARYLERPQIVRAGSANRLDVRANEWWGEPLAPMLTRVLVENLSQRLPNSVVFGENGAINSPADATVEVNIERLDAVSAQTVDLIAHTAVIFTSGKAQRSLRTVRVQEAAPSADVPGEVAATSAAIGRLAGNIVQQLAGSANGS